MKKDELKSSADLFIYKAEKDYHAAAVMYAAGQSGDAEIEPEIILFHLQQSVEKSLKALLSYHRIRITHTHDIQKLADLCSDSGLVLPTSVGQLTILTGFAVEGRYSLLHDDMKMCDELLPVVDLFMRSIQGILK